MIITRKQFKKHWSNMRPSFAAKTSGLWIPEKSINGPVSQCFVCTKPIKLYSDYKSVFDEFENNITGIIRCYSSSNTLEEEWWGFTEKDDALWFCLRWG